MCTTTLAGAVPTCSSPIAYRQPPTANRTSAGGANAGAKPTSSKEPAGKPCTLTLTGRLLSEHDSEPLAYATILGGNPAQGVVADESGNFTLLNLCPGNQVLTFSHVGCDNEETTFTVTTDTSVTVYLHHHDNYTETIVVTGRNNTGYSTEQDDQATTQLADALEHITGISTLRSGTSASKPVYDGVFGNRLSLQNNGIAQTGQQWGNDHAPEIDPWVAAYVRVIEGVEALKYAGSTVAATVLIEPAPLRKDGPAAGKAAYGFQTNGRGHTLNARLSRSGKTAYRLSASGKLFGDHRTPDHFLTNTGRKEANGALQLARFHDDRWTSKLYYSVFNAEIGVLRGAHIGNTTDLQAALEREVPFFTTDEFSYTIAPPRQAVTHHLLKAETEFRPNEDHRLTLRYGGQLNDRREFDVRRGGRSGKASLSLQQVSHLFEGAWHHELGPDRHLDASAQFDVVYNDNQPGTGVYPLIPDYNASRGSGYLAYHQEGESFQYHAGLRYDRQFYEAITLTRGANSRVERFEHVFNTFGGSVELLRKLNARTRLLAGLTLRQRAPQINELYSDGLHQGVSSLERGDQTLEPEQSLKMTAGILFAGTKLTLNAGLFAQPIRDYIYLEPQAEPELTVRGAFPLFLYRGGDAFLYGANLSAVYLPTPEWKLDGRLAVVRGYNRSEGRPLVFVPTDNLRFALSHYPAEGWMIGAEWLAVAQQNRLEEDQDFLAPPPAYSLLDLSFSREITLPSNRTLHLRAAAQNVLNTRYRDYLDRQRYFANALGRSVELRVSFEW